MIVLHAHVDRWTIGADYPPEERARMRRALLGFAAEWLAAKGRVSIASPRKTVEDTDEQREALERWRARGKKATPEVLEAALDVVLTGALWESPTFKRADSTLKFHRAWRIQLERTPPTARQAALDALCKRWGLIPRAK